MLVQSSGDKQICEGKLSAVLSQRLTGRRSNSTSHFATHIGLTPVAAWKSSSRHTPREEPGGSKVRARRGKSGAPLRVAGSPLRLADLLVAM